MATLSASEPHGFLAVFGDRLEHETVIKDQAHAEGYAARSHGLCLRLYLSAADEALLSEKRAALLTGRESP